MIFCMEVELDLGYVGYVGQGQMPKVVFSHGFYLVLRSGSRVKSKVTGQCQRSWSNFWCTAVDIRGSALPSAAKSNKSHY